MDVNRAPPLWLYAKLGWWLTHCGNLLFKLVAESETVGFRKDERRSTPTPKSHPVRGSPGIVSLKNSTCSPNRRLSDRWRPAIWQHAFGQLAVNVHFRSCAVSCHARVPRPLHTHRGPVVFSLGLQHLLLQGSIIMCPLWEEPCVILMSLLVSRRNSKGSVP